MPQMARVKAAEDQLQRLLDSCDRDALTQSLRLLALYVATFKEQHGELDSSWVTAQLENELSYDPATIRIFENGLHEAIAMLSMARATQQSGCQATGTLVN